MNSKKHQLILFLVLIFAVPVFIIILAQAGLFSGSAPTNLGVVNNRLQVPLKGNNSVSSQADFFNKSEANIEYAKIEPLNYKGNGQAALILIKESISIKFKEATLISEKENYLHYEFKTSLMKLIDDVEFFLHEQENYIHFRSASRLDLNDLGRNRKRMEEIRKFFMEVNK